VPAHFEEKMKNKKGLSRSIVLAVCAKVFAATFAYAGNETSADTNSIIKESATQRDARMKWWREARFGLFIHWGLYSIPAGEWQGKTNYGEWILEETHMPVSQYEKFAEQFNPVKFDASTWVRAAKAAGIKYIVITSKHHDGFGMFRSDLTDWCVRRTPFQRDPLTELAAACKAEGIRFCLYHSIMDWHHPDWGIRRPWNDVAANAGPPDMDRYVAYMKGQLKELLTRYGPIGLLWFDGQWESPWTAERGVDLYNYVRGLQSDIIINNRVGKPVHTAGGGMAQTGAVGDYGTPEQTIPPAGFGPGVDWESCMTMNDHWGYNKFDEHWKSTQTLVRNLIDCASKGGNYLLNVGPTSEGLIPAPSVERLKEIGDWMRINGEAIYGTTASPFNKRLPWGCTQKVAGNLTTLYLHVFDWPADGQLFVPGLKSKVGKAYLLADKSQQKLGTKMLTDGVQVRLPTNDASAFSTTIVLEIKGTVAVEAGPKIETTASNTYKNEGSQYGPQLAFDGSDETRWATDDSRKQAWIATRFDKMQTIRGVKILEAYPGRVQKFEFQYRDRSGWKTIFSGTTIGETFEKRFDPVKAQEFRLNILDATVGPTIREIELLNK
jgi:alpha-L-fucosidase